MIDVITIHGRVISVSDLPDHQKNMVKEVRLALDLIDQYEYQLSLLKARYDNTARTLEEELADGDAE